MILLRWFAIAGQLTAITVAQQFYGLRLELGLCYLAVGASVIANLRQVIKEGELRMHPVVARLVDPETLKKMGAQQGDG